MEDRSSRRMRNLVTAMARSRSVNRHSVFHQGPNARKFPHRDVRHRLPLGADRRFVFFVTDRRRRQDWHPPTKAASRACGKVQWYMGMFGFIPSGGAAPKFGINPMHRQKWSSDA
jgi:hypothetical protein